MKNRAVLVDLAESRLKAERSIPYRFADRLSKQEKKGSGQRV